MTNWTRNDLGRIGAAEELQLASFKEDGTLRKPVTIWVVRVGDFTPQLVALTDDVLFGDVWERKELTPRERSLITVAALITGGNSEQLPFHLTKAKENGLTETELKEVITHLAFYAGWPKAMSALTVAKQVFEG